MVELRDAHMRTGRSTVIRSVKMLGLGILGILLVLFAIGSVIKYDAARRTPEAVERIHARAITIEMVQGKNLPPMPANPDETIAGVDANQNGIRDDVELAIFAAHPNEPKVRAGQLQYAMILQSQITEVFSEGTLVAVLQEKGRSTGCIRDVYEIRREGLPINSPLDYEPTEQELTLANQYAEEHSKKVKPLISQVEQWVLNTQERRTVYEDSYRHMTSYSGMGKGGDCDVDLDAL